MAASKTSEVEAEVEAVVEEEGEVEVEGEALQPELEKNLLVARLEEQSHHSKRPDLQTSNCEAFLTMHQNNV